MDNSCNCHSEISRDGSGQLDRYLKALDPAYAPIDDRRIEDLLVFAKKYANQVRFYDIPESHINDNTEPAKVSWREFFRRDIAVVVASIALVDADKFKKDYEEQRAKVEAKPGYDIFDDLFDPILGMASKIDGWYSLALPEYPLYADLELAINSNLKEQMQKIIAYKKGLQVIDSRYQFNFENLLQEFSIKNKDRWNLSDAINGDSSIYQGKETEDKLLNATLHVDDIFNAFYSFLTQLVTNSESYMQFALKQYPAHQPHMALFIAFLKLFGLAQEQMNGLTGRMLDFYYKDVLHLTTKPSIPDKVHIVFELAKDVAEYNVAPGTQLNGGKDAAGKEQVYKTVNDLVVNQAIVKELKTIFIEKEEMAVQLADDSVINNQIIQHIYARPVAKSKDGFGEPFTDTNPKWPTFGKGSTVIDSTGNMCSQVTALDEPERTDVARVGFAIASPQLLLQGGKRLIGIKLNGDNALFARAKEFEAQNSGKNFFEIALTGENEWLTIQNVMTDDEWKNLIVSYKNTSGVAESTGIFNPELSGLQSTYFIDIENNNIGIYLPIAAQPVVAFNPAVHAGYIFKTTQPVIKIMLNTSINLTEEEYKAFEVASVNLQVKVGSINPPAETIKEIIDSGEVQSPGNLFTYHSDGLKTLVIQNETGLVQPGKPFDPFTAYPNRGKAFYIGSGEVFNKPLGQLAVNISRTQQNTRGFIQNQSSNNDYIACVLHNRDWDRLSPGDEWYFTQEELTANILNHLKEELLGETLVTRREPVVLSRKPILPVTEWQPQTEKGFLEIVYRGLFDNANDLQARQNKAPELEIREISVSYESALMALEPEIDQLFHVYPFGVVETYITAEEGEEETPAANTFAALDKAKEGLVVNAKNALLPQFNYLGPYSQYYTGSSSNAAVSNTAFNHLVSAKAAGSAMAKLVNQSKSRHAARLMASAGSTEETGVGEANQYTGDMQQGMLFIGLQNLKPLQSISMLFQFAEGSAGNEDNDPPSINWSYLSYNEWKPMKAENIVSDGTYGFQTTGIIKMDIPADASAHNTIITDGLIWLCAGVTKDVDRIPQLIDVVTQAVEAVFEDQSNAPSHFDNVLPAGSIGKLATPVAQVSKVQQPFASFDGKHSEVGKEFYTRVSERLRHKARAITAWDYEHLVLNRFLSIYKVKCITHTDPNCLCRTSIAGDACCGPQVAPGHVLLVPITNLKNRNAVNPLQPKTSRRTLLAIQDYIKTRTSPFVRVHAKNPVYEEIIVSFKVKFYTGTDKGFYMKKLNDEIVHFLTPWAFDEEAVVTFNQEIHASSIINFIEERPYVDFITDFVMGVCCNECCPPVATPAGTTIKGAIKDSAGKPLPEVNIRAQPNSTFTDISSDASGKYENVSVGPGVVTVGFSLPGYQTRIITVGEKQEINITLYKLSEMLQRADSCHDIEHVLQDDPEFEGDIVARPCTSRSILVSVPRHIIIPYEEQEQESPCEMRRKTTRAENVMRLAQAPAALKKVAPAKKAATKKAAIKKRTEKAPDKSKNNNTKTNDTKGTDATPEPGQPE